MINAYLTRYVFYILRVITHMETNEGHEMNTRKQDLLSRLAKARGDEVKLAREERGWSQAQLAEAAGTSQQTVDRIERGVTGSSKALPEIQKVLGIARYDLGRPLADRTPEEQAAVDAPFKAYIREKTMSLDVAEGTHIPVYGMAPVHGSAGGLIRTTQFADTIPRMFPVQNVKDAYAIISRDYQINPIIRPGDIVVVNPNLPPVPLSEVVITRTEGDEYYAVIRSLIQEDESSWTVANSDGETHTFQKDEWPRAEVIVAKISRVR